MRAVAHRPGLAIAAATVALLLGAAGAASGKQRAGAEKAIASAAHTRILVHSSVRNAGIFAMTPQGGGRHRLRKGLVDALSVSASGRRIAFANSRPTPCSRCPADFFVDVFLADGQARHVHRVKRFKHASIESLALSPDGRRIVAVIYRGAGSDLYAMRANGSGVRRLTTSRQDESGVSFSPDGRRIAFSREGARGSAIYSMRFRGGGLRRVSRGSGSDSDPVYSPNGRLIAFSRDDGGALGLRSLFVMRTDGTHRRRVTHHRAGVEDLQPDFSPNGRALAFARGTGVEFDIYTVRVSGGGVRQAAHAGIGLIDPDWSRRP